MIVRHLKLDGINGSLVTLNGVKEAANEEIVELHLQDGTVRTGRVVKIDGEEVTVQVFEGTRGVSMENTATVFTGKPMEVALSPEILGRVFDGLGRPIDGLGPVYPVEKRDVNGSPINPVSRVLYRRARHADSRPEAADFLRFRYETQRIGGSDCPPVHNCRR